MRGSSCSSTLPLFANPHIGTTVGPAASERMTDGSTERLIHGVGREASVGRMSATTDYEPASGMVLRVLRIALHAGFAVLLTVGSARLLATEPGQPSSYAALAVAVVLAAVYAAGTVLETLQPALVRHGAYWLAAVTAIWVVLVALSADFSWLAFPLFFLHLRILGPRHAVAAVAALTAAVVLSQWWHAGEFSLPLLVGPVVGAVFAVIMGMAYRALYTEAVNQRRALEELQRTRAELAETQHRAGVLAERERLARDIHDTLAQGLSSIVLVSRSAGSALRAGNTESARKRLQTVQETAAENLAEARRFVRGITAPEEPLASSLRRLCESTERQAAARGGSLRCRFAVNGDAVGLPAPYEVTLLRAAQASLANVAAHAGAATAVVTLGYLDGDVTLDIYDDGAGFDPASLPETPRGDGTGFGLLSLRERARALHGTLSVESEPGEGTVVALRLPRREVPGE